VGLSNPPWPARTIRRSAQQPSRQSGADGSQRHTDRGRSGRA
jgi:hypothetical protein